MVKVKVNKKMIIVDKCIHCMNLKSKNVDTMCKKHTALFDYDKFIKKGAVFNYNNKKFILFSLNSFKTFTSAPGLFSVVNVIDVFASTLDGTDTAFVLITMNLVILLDCLTNYSLKKIFVKKSSDINGFLRAD